MKKLLVALILCSFAIACGSEPAKDEKPEVKAQNKTKKENMFITLHGSSNYNDCRHEYVTELRINLKFLTRFSPHSNGKCHSQITITTSGQGYTWGTYGTLESPQQIQELIDKAEKE